MGGVIGFTKKNDCVMDLFFGTDYHSHLGTKRGGMCVLEKDGFNRAIHNIGSSPFRTKFEEELEEMEGNMGIGAISDSDPQPLTVYSRHGDFAITTVGRINNKDEIIASAKCSWPGSPWLQCWHWLTISCFPLIWRFGRHW